MVVIKESKEKKTPVYATHEREYGFVFGDRVGSRADLISLPDSYGIGCVDDQSRKEEEWRPKICTKKTQQPNGHCKTKSLVG